MTACRYDRDTADYLTPDGTPCTHDEYGDPTYHCTRPRCSYHVGAGEQTCARCVGNTRARVAALVDHAALLAVEAVERGSVNSEPVNLSTHAADPEAWGHREASARAGRVTASPVDRDAKKHPEYLLRWWAMTVRDAYGHPEPVGETLTDAAAYLDRTLNQFAQDPILGGDPDHSCTQMHRELGAAINHAATVLRDTDRPQRGAPCPFCVEAEQLPRRLTYVHSHTVEADYWQCPTDTSHWINTSDYTTWITERKRATS